MRMTLIKSRITISELDRSSHEGRKALSSWLVEIAGLVAAGDFNKTREVTFEEVFP